MDPLLLVELHLLAHDAAHTFESGEDTLDGVPLDSFIDVGGQSKELKDMNLIRILEDYLVQVVC